MPAPNASRPVVTSVPVLWPDFSVVVVVVVVAAGAAAAAGAGA
jgi:hypothetical protein